MRDVQVIAGLCCPTCGRQIRDGDLVVEPMSPVNSSQEIAGVMYAPPRHHLDCYRAVRERDLRHEIQTMTRVAVVGDPEATRAR